ncbi:hypothetical protein HU200_003445 [Digitaria exilis]|uniref:F-box domain-containing protein n=1 Tax=Digitaria exilis TaxID=1010633 RepID=A0A835FX78_9POAL|nr:hypothetical protein HU200_003445 [Digitaria exilis]
MMGSSDDDKMCRGILVADDIPADLVISEVLVRLPIKSIVCCHCVCRSWCAAISGAAFVCRHRDLSRARPPRRLPCSPSSSSSTATDTLPIT